MTKTLLSLSIATVFSLLFADVAFAYRPTEWLGSGDEGLLAPADGKIWGLVILSYVVSVVIQFWWDKRLDLCMTFWEKCMWAGWSMPVGMIVVVFIIIPIFEL